MSNSPKKFSRREFNLAGFSAGIATLTTPWMASAQEAKKAEKVPQKKIRKQAVQQQVETGPSTPPPSPSSSYDNLELVAELDVSEAHIDVKLYIRNTSKKAISVPHSIGGVPHAIPEGILVLSQEKLAIQMRLPPEAFAAVTRAANVEYMNVPPAGKDDIKALYGHFIGEWPSSMVENGKRYAKVEAKLNLTLTLDRMMPMTRTGSRRSDLHMLSDTFKLPKNFKAGI